jgi:conjugal transfer pilus assembly protein TraL
MTAKRFPRHIDKPQRLLLWQADEIVPAFFLFGLGIMLNQIVLFTVAAMASVWFFRKFRNAKPDGYLFHALYWYGFAPLSARQAINPFLRRVLPS